MPAEASSSGLPERVKHLHPPLAHPARNKLGTLRTTTCMAELMLTG